jgi:hypothetical protein
MLRWFIIIALMLTACAPAPEPSNVAATKIAVQDKRIYVVPFETVMVPFEVSDGLFDLFVDRLNREGTAKGLEFIILKQALTEIDPAWLTDKNYLRGELFAYVEEIGSSMTSIKARSRLRFYRPGAVEPALQLVFPTESFYQNDYSSLADERRKLATEVAETLADRFLSSLALP